MYIYIYIRMGTRVNLLMYVSFGYLCFCILLVGFPFVVLCSYGARMDIC